MSRKLTIDEWNQRLAIMNPNARILSKHIEKQKDVYLIHCNDCNATYDVTLSDLKVAYSNRKRKVITSKYCPVCTSHRCYKGINDVATLRKDLLPYFINTEDAENYTVGSSHKVSLRCPYCKKTKLMSLNQLSYEGFVCKYCADSISIPNKMLRGLMQQLPVQDGS